MEFLECRKGLNVNQIVQIDTVYRLNLPEPLLEILKQCNGGMPKMNAFNGIDDIYYIQEFLGLGVPGPSISIERAKEILVNEEEILPSDAVPFAVDSSGDFFYTKPSHNGSKNEVWFFSSDDKSDESEGRILLSSDLREFLSLLYEAE